VPTVDFHTHSTCSDGTLEPERLAVWLASKGARYASLTDHDTISGLTRFRTALSRRGIACIDGVEMTARCSLGEVHILAYSAIPFHKDIAALLPPQTGGRWGAGLAGMAEQSGRNGHPVVPEARALISSLRKAGAATFLAHPFTVSRDLAVLGKLVDELAAAGLDGIEAIYEAYSPAERDALLALAARTGLATCAGSDLHEPGSNGPQGVVKMEDAQWRAFRDSIFGRTAAPLVKSGGFDPSGAEPASIDAGDSYPATDVKSQPEAKKQRKRTAKQANKKPLSRMAFGARVAFPALAVIALFVVSMFAIVIPQVRGMLLDHKKETIREISESVVSILAEYEKEIQAGLVTPEKARAEAATRVRDLRYGPVNKDYLWITDSLPRMVMHPYRPELNGQDLRDFKDEAGLPVFVEFVRAASVAEGGYVEYLWQWEDEADRVVPKLSYVIRFAPWDWILGTGVYLEDVNEEILALTNGIVLVSTGVSAILAILLSFMVQHSLATEKARQAAENAMKESRERYRVLVEASREGMAIVMDGAFTFANTALLELTAYSEHEFLLLSVGDVLSPFPDGTDESARFLGSLGKGSAVAESLPPPFSCSLACKDGKRLDAMVSAAGFGLGGNEGVMLAVRREGGYGAADLHDASESAEREDTGTVGTFAARWSRRAGLLRANDAALRLFGLQTGLDLSRSGLFGLFSEGGEEVYRSLETTGMAARHRVRVPIAGSGNGSVQRELLITALIINGAEGEESRVEGIVEDITQEIQSGTAEKERAAAKDAKRSAALEKVSTLGIAPVVCAPGDPVQSVALAMTAKDTSVALVLDAEGRTLGSVSESDLSRRVVAGKLDPSTPVFRVMSAPVHLVPESTSIAMARAELTRTGHGWIALQGPDGSVRHIVLLGDMPLAGEDDLSALLAGIAQARSTGELAAARNSILGRVAAMTAAGVRARLIVNLLTEVHDAIVVRLIELACGSSSNASMGEPPCAWAFVALGSAGRREMLPDSDQDNAIIFDPADGDGQKERAWFLSLGAFVCAGLEAAGIPPCKHGVMAKNAEWCLSRVEWESRYERWVAEPEPERIVNLNALIDIRTVAGESGLVPGLRGHFRRAVAMTPAFLTHLANGSRNLRIPSPAAADASMSQEAAMVAAKEAAGLFPAFARVYATKTGLSETGTFDRLKALAASGDLWDDTARESAESYEALLDARLKMNVNQSSQNGIPTDAKGTTRSRLAEAILRTALSQATVLQKRIGFDFTGQPG